MANSICSEITKGKIFVGIFSAILDAASHANEEAHGSRLASQFSDTVSRMSVMNKDMSDEIIRRFVEKRGVIKREMLNWTDDGKITISKKLRKSARETADLNMVEGYALWMTSAWLESGIRTSPKAFNVFVSLDELAKAHESLGVHASASSGRTKIEQVENDMADDPEEVLFGAISEVLRSCGISRPTNSSSNGMERLSRRQLEALAATVCGIGIVVAHRHKLDPEEIMGLGIGILEHFRMDKNIAVNGMALAIKEYSPSPDTIIGKCAWHGAESMRRYLDCYDDQLDCEYISDYITPF
jgi:hypothetical protein